MGRLRRFGGRPGFCGFGSVGDTQSNPLPLLLSLGSNQSSPPWLPWPAFLWSVSLSSESVFHLGKDKITKSPAHQWITKTCNDSVYKAVTSWTRTQPGKIYCFVHRISDRVFDRRLCLGHFIILSNCSGITGTATCRRQHRCAT
jgi:hypothetical protein